MIRCLDASVWVKFLTPEEGSPQAESLCLASVSGEVKLVGPPFLPAEVGSVLRKKVRAGLLTADESWALWTRFLDLPVRLAEGGEFWRRAWLWALRAEQPTLYDACYLAAVEAATTLATEDAVETVETAKVEKSAEEVARAGGESLEFWTADTALVQALGSGRPPWVHLLSEWQVDDVG